MKCLSAMLLAAGLLASSAAMANPDMIRAKNCVACHAIGNKVVGPAFKDVATKYAGQKDAEQRLAAKIVKGGSGSWGPIPMPPNTQVGEAESRALAKWILSLK